MSDAAFATLARAREAAGLSLEQAARQLKFAPRQLEALEAGELQRLQGGTFARGMVRSYARLLHVDPEPLLAQISAQVAPPDAERLAQRYSQPVPFADGARRSNIAYAALSLTLLVVVAAVALQWRQERASERTLAFMSPAQLATAPVGKSSPTMASLSSGNASASAPPSGKAPGGTPATATAPSSKTSAAAPSVIASAKPAAVAPAGSASSGPRTLALQFEGESWVEIRSGSGKLLVASLNAAGTERVVSGLPPFEIVIGNAQQVRLTYNDKPVDLTPYVKVEVARFTLP
jgi:cytoskeleton protein RodZ